MLFAIAFASGGMLLWPAISSSVGAGLSAGGAVQLINRERAVVIDVGDAEEFAEGHDFDLERALVNHEQAQALAGGLKSWKDANLPLEKA